MKKIKKKIANHTWFLVILGIAFVLRLLNPTYAQPTLYITGDEPPNYLGAMYVLVNKNLLVRTAIYPPFGSYFQAPFLLFTFGMMFVLGKIKSVNDLIFLTVTQPGYFLFVSRLLSGIMGSLTVIVLYNIVRLLLPRNKLLPLLAIFFLAFSFNHGQVSHFGRPWASAMFFLSLTIYFALKSIYDKRREKKYVFLSAISAILTYGFHQTGVFAVGYFVIIRIIEKCQSLSWKKSMASPLTWRGIMIMSVGIGLVRLLEIGNPTTDWFPSTNQFPSNYPLILKVFELVRNSNLVFNLKQLVTTEPAIFLLFLVSFIIPFSRKKSLISILVGTIITFLVVGMSFKQTRYMLPAIIPMCIFAALGFQKIIIKIRPPIIRYLLTTLILIMSASNLVWWNWLFIQKSTIEQSVTWLETNIPRNEIILSGAGKSIPFTPAQDVLPIQQLKNPNYYQQAGKLLKVGEYPDNVRNIIYLFEITDITRPETIPEFLDSFSLPFKYLIDAYYDPHSSNLRYLNQEKYKKLVTFSPLKKNQEIIPIGNVFTTVNEPLLPLLFFKSERTGPYIDIYKVATNKE